MRLFIYAILVAIAMSGLIGFFVINFNDGESLNDFEKQADFLTSKNEYEKAIFYYDKILLEEPHSTKILLNKANALMSLNKFEQAIELFDVVLELDPGNDFAQKNKLLATEKRTLSPIQSKSILNDDKFADKLVLSPLSEPELPLPPYNDPALNDPFVSQKLPSSTKSPITDDIIQANKLYDEQKYLEALSIYDSVLQDDPSNLYALNGKAGTLLSLKHFDESIATFDVTLSLYPDNVNALNGKAYAYHLKAIFMRLPGILYDSVHGYEKSLEVDPKNLNALIGMSSALMALERYDEAIDYYKEALAIDPDYGNAENGLFSLWIKLGNDEARYFYFDSAIVYFDKVLELDPNNLEALLAKASAYTEWGKSKEKYYSISESTYTEILEYYPNNTRALVGMGYVLSEQLEFEQALLYYEQALEIDPKNTNAQAGKSFVLKRVK